MDSYICVISAGVFIAFVIVPLVWQVIGLLARRKRHVRCDGYVYHHTPTGRICVPSHADRQDQIAQGPETSASALLSLERKGK